LDEVVVFIHVICGAAFVVTMAMMQLVVGPAMSRLPASEDKLKVVAVIQGRAQPAMDIVIIILIVTAAYLVTSKWALVAANHWLHIKLSFGAFALTLAALLHFYWRGKKKRLKTEGLTEQFQALSKRTMTLEKVVLVTAWITFLMGVAFNHT